VVTRVTGYGARFNLAPTQAPAKAKPAAHIVERKVFRKAVNLETKIAAAVLVEGNAC
jgi:hypothetical protein